ncbi:hypothetical protein [Comamonas aquatica]|nr:hypothetical protein [Comamonas aquatica]MDH1815675.1 hypothetical protein [Comamonas aquatica]
MHLLDTTTAPAEADFGYTPPPQFPPPAPPEQVRELLEPTDSEHSADAL